MIPLRATGTTRKMAENQDEYKTLAIQDVVLDSGHQAMVSKWEPTPAELEMLNRGGAVVLMILGTGHPPVHLSTQEPPE